MILKIGDYIVANHMDGYSFCGQITEIRKDVIEMTNARIFKDGKMRREGYYDFILSNVTIIGHDYNFDLGI